MKANRAVRRALAPGRRFLDDERGVSEAVGYIVTFGISTVILVTSLQTFTTIKDHTDTLAVDAALRDVAAQVVFAVEEALRAGSTYPDAKFSMSLQLPRELNGQPYIVEFNATRIAVVSQEADAERWAGTEPLDVSGRYYLEFLDRAKVNVLCTQPTPPTIPGGTCVVDSGVGEVTVTYDQPTGFARGAYFAS